MLEYLQNYECCMNRILEVSTGKDLKTVGFKFIKKTQFCEPTSCLDRFKNKFNIQFSLFSLNIYKSNELESTFI